MNQASGMALHLEIVRNNSVKIKIAKPYKKRPSVDTMIAAHQASRNAPDSTVKSLRTEYVELSIIIHQATANYSKICELECIDNGDRLNTRFLQSHNQRPEA